MFKLHLWWKKRYVGNIYAFSKLLQKHFARFIYFQSWSSITLANSWMQGTKGSMETDAEAPFFAID